jgi:trigger factor
LCFDDDWNKGQSSKHKVQNQEEPNMKSELTDVSPTRKELKIEIEPAQVRETYDRISDEFIKKAKVPGFRDGHAPRSVVRTRYKNEIRTEVLRELVPDAVNNAIIDHSLDAIGEPDVHLENEETLERLGEESIKVKVGVEVPPEITLGEYKGLAATRSTRPVTDDDINQTVESLREGLAAMVPVEDRASELGDTVTINALGKEVDQPDAEEIKVDDIEVVLGGPNVQKEFTENLTGVKPDDKKTFTVEYPADFSTAQLAGKKVEYEMEVTAVRRRELPEVDDEWAKSVGEEFDSVDTLKKRIREDLEARAQSDADNKLRADLIRTLVSAHQFEVPESWVQKQTNQRFESVLRDMMARGIDPRTQQVNWEGAREELKVQAEEDVRATLLMERIADTEKLIVSDEEVEAEIELMAQLARQPIEQMRAALTKHGGERSIAQRLRNRKALDLLIENANITDAEWNEETQASAATTNE